MTGTTDQRVQPGGDLASAARDTGMEKLEGAKGQLAEGAERVAAAVERTADELEGDGDEAISGFGRSVASLMRQLAGGLRERDVEQFAGELGALARRNPAVFLAGSVALGFGVARFFRARPPQRSLEARAWRDSDARDEADEFTSGTAFDSRADFDSDESLDLSSNPTGVDRSGERAELDAGAEPTPSGVSPASSPASRNDSALPGNTTEGASRGGKAS